MNQMLHIGFKGKNNASCILVKSISTDSYLLTNSFEGLKRDIENLDYSYDYVILFGIDKNLVNAVRIEKATEKETKEYSLLNLENLSAQLNAVGISNHLSDMPTGYLCNAAYWYLLRKFNGNAVLVHIPSIKNIDENLMKSLKMVFN